MDHYDLGVIPDELQRPLVDDPDGSSASTAYDYSERIPPTDPRLRNYARFLGRASRRAHARIQPLLCGAARPSQSLEGARCLAPRSCRMFHPTDPATGEMMFPLPTWSRHLPATAQRWMEEEVQKKAAQTALRLWHINETIFADFPHYLAAPAPTPWAPCPASRSTPNSSCFVRLGLSPREALAAATNNYALQFGWNELGLIAPGRRADILVRRCRPHRQHLERPPHLRHHPQRRSPRPRFPPPPEKVISPNTFKNSSHFLGNSLFPFLRPVLWTRIAQHL